MTPLNKIERYYSCRIDFEASWDDLEKIKTKAFKWAGTSVDLESFDGNPACHPYLEVKSQSMEAISQWVGKTYRYINRFKNVRLLS